LTEKTRPRRRRPNWRPIFLSVIRDTGNVRLAADAAGVNRTTPYALARRDPAFAAAWADAEQAATDVLEGEARRRALISSDALLMFLLRAHRPERYRESVDVRLDFRREAERIATKLGVPVDDVLEAATRTAREAVGR
jgi:hypothetical protein